MHRRHLLREYKQDNNHSPKSDTKFVRAFEAESDEHNEIPKNLNKQPYGTIVFACVLFVGGFVSSLSITTNNLKRDNLFINLNIYFQICLILSSMIYLSYLDTIYDDRALPVLLLGFMMLIPGAYYCYIILCVFLRVPNYSFDQIPQFNY